MKARWLLVVAVALLAISAQPVAAQNATAVASEHTTFGTGSAGEPAPTALTNMTVTGSGGESASVVLSGGDVIDSFEDNDLDEYGAGTAAYQIQSAVVYDGQFALTNTTSDSGDDAMPSTSGLPAYPDPGDTFSARIRFNASAPASKAYFGWAQQSDSVAAPDGYFLDIGSGGTIVLKKRTSGSNTELDSTSASVPAGEWLKVTVDWQTDGTMAVTIADASGSTLATLSATDTAYTDGGIRVGDQGGGGQLYFDALMIDGQPVASGTYISAPHDAEDISQGWTDLTLTNASATVTWQEDADGDGTWSNVTSTTVSSTTNVTQDLSGTASDRWRLRVDVSKTDSDPVAEIHDEGLLFPSSNPVLSNADPSDGAEIDSYDGDISINVSDGDFGLAQGESVNVTATNSSGGQIGQQTVTSNQTVTFSYSALAGDNNITWTATDNYSNTDTFTQNFSTPATLTLVNESNTSQIVKTQAEVQVRFFGSSDTIVERSTTDGTVSLDGLDTDEEYVVSVEAENYSARRVIIKDLFEQQRIYLLPDSVDNVTVEFRLTDFTGEFDQRESRLFIKKAINDSGTVKFQVVAADEFGASGFTTELEQGSRYRLTVESPDGDQRNLGSYQAEVSEVVDLQIQSVGGEQSETENVAYNISRTNTTSVFVNAEYNDTDELTETIYVEIYERGNESNVLLSNTSFTAGPYGSFKLSEPVPASENDTTWMVKLTAIRTGADDIVIKEPVGPRSEVLPDFPGWLKSLFSISLIWLVAGLFSQVNGDIGALVVAGLGGLLWFVSFLPPQTGVGVVVLSMVTAGLMFVNERRDGGL